MSLTAAQVDTLLQPIKPRRVLKAQNQSHVAAFDVIAHLSRVFGFGGWDKEILSLDLVHERIEDQGGKQRAWVTYRCVMRLTVKDPHGNTVARLEDAATGSAQNMPGVGDAHDFAVKNAVSYALKRCAKDLGDQFGLSLYNKGQTGALVGKTLVHPSNADQGDVEEHAPAPLSMGNDERQEPESADGGGVSGTATGDPATGPPDIPCTKETWDAVLRKIQVELNEEQVEQLQAWAHERRWKVTRRSLLESQAQQVLAWLPAEVPGQQTIDGGEVA